MSNIDRALSELDEQMDRLHVQLDEVAVEMLRQAMKAKEIEAKLDAGFASLKLQSKSKE